jgi:hydrogenase 3 maturation protease
LKEPDGLIILERIRSLALSGRTLVIGLGNPDRADDGAGIEIVSHWKARLKERAFFDTETSAETAVFDGLEDPDAEVFLFVDTADFGGKAGEIRLFEGEETPRFEPAISTHKVPIGLLTEMIRSKGRRAVLLGIQPGSLELFGRMTEEAAEAVKTLKSLMDQENSGSPSNKAADPS